MLQQQVTAPIKKHISIPRLSWKRKKRIRKRKKIKIHYPIKKKPLTCERLYLKNSLCISGHCEIHTAQWRKEHIYPGTPEFHSRCDELTEIFVKDDILEEILSNVEYILFPKKIGAKNGNSIKSKCPKCHFILGSQQERTLKSHQNSKNCTINSCLSCLKIFTNKNKHVCSNPICPSKKDFKIIKSQQGPILIKTDPSNFDKNDSKYFNHVKNIANKILQSPFDLIKLNGVKGSCKTSIMKYVEENNFYSLMFTKKPSDFDFFTTILKMVYIKLFLLKQHIAFEPKMASFHYHYSATLKKNYIVKIARALGLSGIELNFIILLDYKLSSNELLKLYKLCTYFNPIEIAQKRYINIKFVYLENQEQQYYFKHYYLYLGTPVHIIDTEMSNLEFSKFILSQNCKHLPFPMKNFINNYAMFTNGHNFYNTLKQNWQYFRISFEPYVMIKESNQTQKKSLETKLAQLFCENIATGFFPFCIQELKKEEILMIPIITLNFCKNQPFYIFSTKKNANFKLTDCNTYLSYYKVKSTVSTDDNVKKKPLQLLDPNIVNLIDFVDMLIASDQISLDKILTSMCQSGLIEQYDEFYIFNMANFNYMIKMATIFHQNHKWGLHKLFEVKKYLSRVEKLDTWSYYNYCVIRGQKVLCPV